MKWRALLFPLSFLYGAAGALRNWFFDIDVLSEIRVDVPVVCVGNISAGGVGKTPLVELIGRQLQASGKRVAILSRGYGRKTSGYTVVSNGRQLCAVIEDSGDEPSELARALPDVVVAVDADRVRGARSLVEHFHPDVILLDDGFQHRALRRDYNIVVMTAQEILQGELLLPAGNRREPLSALRRAHCAVITKSRDDAELQRATAKLAERFKGGIYGAETRLQALKRASTDQSCELGKIAGKKTLLFSGIGRPEYFESTLRSLNLTIVDRIVFPDHHWYGAADIGKIEQAARNSAVEIVVTTRKDMQRLTGERAQRMLEEFPVYVAHIRSHIKEDEKRFFEELNTIWS